MSRSCIILGLGALLLSGCASSSAPRLHAPNRVEAYCGDRVAMLTAIESIVSSTGDAPDPAPPDAAIRASVRATGGVVAHWPDQLLYLPKTAKSLGVDGDYVTLDDAAIRNDGAGAESRTIYLTLKTQAGPKTLALKAFDVQDVCNEGKLKS